MTLHETFEVEFTHNLLGSRQTNPFRFHGKGSLSIEPDFVTVRAKRYRALRTGVPEEHRLRMVDIVNVRSDYRELAFDVQGVKGDVSISVKVPDPHAANRIMELLPARQTEDFAVARNEAEVFHQRLDHWGTSTPVVKTLIAANIGVFVLMMFYPSEPGAVNEALKLVAWGSNFGPLTLGGQWWRLLTSMFLHGGVLHLLINMYALWSVGHLAERMFGSARFVALYMVAGVCGALASVLWNPHVNSVGASGAILGIIGGLLAFVHRPDSGVPGTIFKALRGWLGGFLLYTFIGGLVIPHIDNAAHLGGLVAGYVAGLMLARSLHLPTGPTHEEKRG